MENWQNENQMYEMTKTPILINVATVMAKVIHVIRLVYESIASVPRF